MVYFQLYESYQEGQSSKTLTLIRFRVYIHWVFAHLTGQLPTWQMGICPYVGICPHFWACAHLALGHLPAWVWQVGICPLMQISLNDDMSLDWWGCW